MAKTHADEIHCTTLPTLWEHWWFQRQNPTGTIKLMTQLPETRWSPA
jgi:hypothetical protein